MTNILLFAHFDLFKPSEDVKIKKFLFYCFAELKPEFSGCSNANSVVGVNHSISKCAQANFCIVSSCR